MSSKEKAIHIISEIIVLVGLFIYFSNKNKNIINYIENINKRLDDQERMINKLMMLLNGKKDISEYSKSKKQTSPTSTSEPGRSNKKKQEIQRGQSGKEKDSTFNKSPMSSFGPSTSSTALRPASPKSRTRDRFSQRPPSGSGGAMPDCEDAAKGNTINKNNESRLNMLSSIATELSECSSDGAASSFVSDRAGGYGRQSGGIILMMNNPLNNRNKNVNFNLQEINEAEDDGGIEESEDQEITDEDEEEINKELESELADLLG
jgi:hypothetical protein